MYTGSKYDSKRSPKETAAAIRKELQARFPEKAGYKISVRQTWSTHSPSIDVIFKKMPCKVFVDDFHKVKVAGKSFDLYHNGVPAGMAGVSARVRYGFTVEADAVIQEAERIRVSYGFDKSDIQSDYFHVDFYGDTTIASDLEAKERAEFFSKVCPAVLVREDFVKEAVLRTGKRWAHASQLAEADRVLLRELEEQIAKSLNLKPQFPSPLHAA